MKQSDQKPESLPRNLRDLLLRDGLIKGQDAVLTPLEGGVSSEICMVSEGENRFAVKRALEKLKVQDDWRADVSRNYHEVAFLRRVGGFLPSSVPRLRHASPEHGYFAMEFLGKEFKNWKQELLDGHCDPETACAAAKVLGRIQVETWSDAAVQAEFETTENFRQLRTDPYLRTSAKRNPALAAEILAEADRIEKTHRCLVHGDFSPKNILLSPGRLVLLDCEVAWFGDPAFDPAFLINHLLLKALLLPEHCDSLLSMARSAWTSYSHEIGPERSAEVEPCVTRLLPMLMLARVDGKSPVEYFREKPEARDRIRRFSAIFIHRPEKTLEEFVSAWQSELGL